MVKGLLCTYRLRGIDRGSKPRIEINSGIKGQPLSHVEDDIDLARTTPQLRATKETGRYDERTLIRKNYNSFGQR
jgi:hypothetical protein